MDSRQLVEAGTAAGNAGAIARVAASERPDYAYRAAKRVIDVAGSLALTIVFSPVIAGVALALARQGGPVLFTHTRIGRNGRRFKLYKFRSMVANADQVLEDLMTSSQEHAETWAREHKLKDDPRITKVGHFLRKTSLDELPQILNVLKGEMSLVGPRPIVDDELPKYGRAARHYLACKPGITGLWQVSGRNDIDYSRRVALDRHYVQHASVLMDLSILLRTVWIVVGRRGAY